ncbi:MAG: pyridoxamine 5'-phosphate oxidase [Solirubrobacteraceae bacterium]
MTALQLEPLREDDVDADPLRQFADWFAAAVQAGIPQPEAAALATVDADGAPSLRMVLVKGVDERGFRFFTNYSSRKARELAANPRAALTLYWGQLGRQVRVTGTIARVTRAESVQYARSRPRGSQLSALASPQSTVIDARESLERRVGELSERYADTAQLPVSDSWGGFRLTPQTIELWQQRADRLHDRLLYTRSADGRWRLTRLAP